MEPDVLEELYRAYYREAYLYTFSLCGNHHITEDIVSEAFVRAYVAVDSPSSSFKYWLLVVCKNLWIDASRKSKYLVPMKDIEDGAIIEDYVLEKVLKRERNKALYSEIMKLNPKVREVVVLYYYGSIPIKDIARLLEMNYSAVKTMLCRGRLKLKDLLIEADRKGEKL